MRDRWYTQDIEITEDHRKLAAHMGVEWRDDVEWGYVEFGDAKRPFGNSDMPRDVAEILGWEIDGDNYDPLTPEQVDRARQLHFEMGYVAKGLLAAFASGLATK